MEKKKKLDLPCSGSFCFPRMFLTPTLYFLRQRPNRDEFTKERDDQRSRMSLDSVCCCPENLLCPGFLLAGILEEEVPPGHSQTALDSCMAAISGNQFKKSESWDFLGDQWLRLGNFQCRV